MEKLFLVLFVFSVTVQADEPYCNRGCPTFWTPYGRGCYRYIAEPKTWVEAEQTCRSFAGSRGLGHLVSIVTEDENSFITQLVSHSRTIVQSDHETCSGHAADPTQAKVLADEQEQEPVNADAAHIPERAGTHTIQNTLTWIGLSDIRSSGNFAWSDNSRVTYTNWLNEQNIEIFEGRDNRDYKKQKRDYEERKHEDEQQEPASGGECAHIVPVTNVLGNERSWDKWPCNDQAARSPFVCRIQWI
ncbi:Alpha-N-acetylgalactosamine-specific lectin [Holothuria leucospilota]|uniref:Alpha-N-acetylgalactosamine-specific lectin n=1 Tax=Holothuria leucospilota TaxID=206669 RepID=A0A9Q1HA72_HOLLE|nr:Alpha-N-acetylgalactosamine-specific lectin [Holothuria leucospilota]